VAQDKDINVAKRRAASELTRGLKPTVAFLFMMSGLISVLALTGSIYMMQVYDRAITSGSVPTLLALSVLAIGLYLFQGFFDTIRSQVLVRVGAKFDKKLAPLAHKVAIEMPRFGFSTAESLERGRDVDTVRSFLGGQGPAALFDLPWIPVYLAFVYMLHPWLGVLTFTGAFVLAILTICSELMTRKLANATRSAAIARNTIADSNARNADVLKAMGFGHRAVHRFNAANIEHLLLQTKTSDIGGTLAATSRVLRMLLQSAVLGLGAFLTMKGELTAGAIMAASVAAGRALAPVDMAIANWKPFVAARTSFDRLRETVVALVTATEPMDLPTAHRALSVEKITVAAPSTGQVILTEVAMELKAGQAVGIIGPSGGGKSTLVRAMTGVWPTLRGAIRLDGADLPMWKEEALGRNIGYLPQDVGLLDATVEENIARFEENPDPEKVIAAARAAGVHDLIVRLPNGYRTQIGPQGMALSAGQRQRIGLARALYGDPFIVIMDEPNSNLDAEGETALRDAILGIKARGGIVIVVAHRPSALSAVDLIGIVQNGRLVAFGPKDEIFAQVGSGQAAAAAAAASGEPAAVHTLDSGKATRRKAS
jgi:PrtD family type I secretion system ABC transporter